MTLVDLISEETVKVPLTSTTKTEVIRELIQILVDADKIKDPEAAFDAIMKRENLGSTGLEQGIAVPHSKCEQIKSLTMAIGISYKGINFESLDGKPSHLFFLILAAIDQAGPHIEALQQIAKITRSPNYLKQIQEARSAKEVVDLFKEE